MKEKRFTYHWVIVLSCFLLMAASIGIVINCFNVFTVSLMDEYGWEADKIQLIGTIVSLSALVGGVFVGKVMAKAEMRLAMPIYALLTVAGFYLYSLCDSLSSFYLVSLMVGIGMSGVSLIPCGALLNNWFSEKKGLATGIAFSGSVAGGMVFVLITQAVVDSHGWRSGYVALGAIAAVILLPTSIFLVREKPSDKGLVPYGADLKNAGEAEIISGISAGRFLKTSSFWLLAVSMFIIGFINMGMQNNFSIYMTEEMGHGQNFATNIFSLVMGIQILGKIVLGAVYDKKGVKFGTIYCTVLFILAALASLRAGNTAVAIIYGCLFGMVCAMTTVTPPYITMLVVGRRHYSTIYGLLSLSYGIGVAIGPVVAAKIYKAQSSYSIAWIAFMLLSILMVFTTLSATKKAPQYRSMME